MGQSKFSYGLTFWFISIENGGKQKGKNTLRVKNNQLCDGEKFLCHRQNMRGWLSYPIFFLQSRGSVIRNIFIEYRTKQATFLRDEIIFMNWWNRYFSSSCSGTIL